MTGKSDASDLPLRTRNRSILLVDNKCFLKRHLSTILSKTDITFADAETCSEALRFCQRTATNIVFIDVNIAYVDAKNTATQLRALGPHMEKTALIAVADKLDRHLIAGYLKAGFTAAIRKPIIEASLIQLINKYTSLPAHMTARTPLDDDAIYAIMDTDEDALLNHDIAKEYRTLLKDRYEPLMENFLSASPDLMGELGEAVVCKDAQQIAALTEKLKSVSLIFGAEHVSNTAAKLEILAQDQDLEHASQFFKELHMSFERIHPVLVKQLQKP
ncbi:MAG: hypothetical protein COB37_11540 [Kordiimonadales bacterium]|nr:MAG: hypothetical protein COB37_11540 [Kordiimonadales bacterium]